MELSSWQNRKIFAIQLNRNSLPTPDADQILLYHLVNYFLYFQHLQDKFDIQPGDAGLYINGLHVDMDSYDPFR